MRTREIGESGLITGVLSLGAWAIGGGSWWGENDDSLSVRAIHCALDQGMNWITPRRSTALGTARRWWAAR